MFALLIERPGDQEEMLLISLELHNTVMKSHSDIYIYRLIQSVSWISLKVAGNGTYAKEVL